MWFLKELGRKIKIFLSFRKAVIAYHLYCLYTAIENRCSLSLYVFRHREKWTSVNLITRFSTIELKSKLRDNVSLMMYTFIALLL